MKRLSAVPDKEEAKEMHFDVIRGREEMFEGIEKAAAAAKKLVRVGVFVTNLILVVGIVWESRW